MQGGHKLDALA